MKYSGKELRIQKVQHQIDKVRKKLSKRMHHRDRLNLIDEYNHLETKLNNIINEKR